MAFHCSKWRNKKKGYSLIETASGFLTLSWTPISSSQEKPSSSSSLEAASLRNRITFRRIKLSQNFSNKMCRSPEMPQNCSILDLGHTRHSQGFYPLQGREQLLFPNSLQSFSVFCFYFLLPKVEKTLCLEEKRKESNEWFWNAQQMLCIGY